MKIGDSPFPSERTTPECPDLLLFLRRAVMAGATHGALEVSSHALALKRVLGIKFTVGVFSNLTPDHLDFHRDMESYYQAKRLLFMPEGENEVELAGVNVDDPWGERLAREIPCPVLRYGFRPEADVRALDAGPATGSLQIETPQGELHLKSRLIGRLNTYNILAAVAAGIGLRIPQESVRAGIESLRGFRVEWNRSTAVSPLRSWLTTPTRRTRWTRRSKRCRSSHTVALSPCSVVAAIATGRSGP